MLAFRQRKAAERLQEAQIAHARADYGAAEAAASAAARLDPELRAAWELWTECLEQQGKRIEAARTLAEALEFHPDDPILQLSFAHAHNEIGQFAAAERMLAELRRQWPSSREPLLHTARTLRDVRELARLRALLEQALDGVFTGDAELAALLHACRIWQAELPDERPPLTSMRERLLSEHGVVLLGTGHDDGLTIPWYSTYLCSNYDVVATCARLRGFAAQFGWRWDRVAAIDPAARVLAILIAEILDAELVDLTSGYPDPERT
ncbi:MAG TPA: tetratricopeptide repeat protein, partial [Enhygromyxa sp.]|nr:tetratricopeptide repeat protein [Enhygromyxa sp.]